MSGLLRARDPEVPRAAGTAYKDAFFFDLSREC